MKNFDRISFSKKEMNERKAIAFDIVITENLNGKQGNFSDSV